MAKSARWIVTALLAFIPAAALGQASAAPAPSVVHAVLFFSPTCPHCHRVMTEDLPPLVQRYGARLRIATVDVSTPGGQALYQATVAHYALPDDRLGVPTLVVGYTVLVGDQEIPQLFPGIIERGLAGRGIGWPDVAEIRAAIARAEQPEAPRQQPGDTERAAQAVPAPSREAPRADTAAAATRDTVRARQPRAAPPSRPAAAPAATQQPGPPAARTADTTPSPGPAVAPDTAVAAPTSMELTETAAPSVRQRFLRDPVGNGAAVVVLVGMLLALGLTARGMLGARAVPSAAPPWLVPVLALAGLGVAGYLTVVEVTGVRAVCGPVGDCNSVQQSAYARLFGVLPIGVLGMAGYVGMLGGWVLGAAVRGRLARLGRLAAWGMAVAGTAFSVYLTFLEPFVIGATCVWCLSSAVIVTLLLLLLTPAAQRELRGGAEPGTAAG